MDRYPSFYKTIIIDPSLRPKDSADKNNAFLDVFKNVFDNVPKALKKTEDQGRAMELLWQYAKDADNYNRDERQHIKNKLPVLGSNSTVNSLGNYGFFSAIIKAYNNHWTLEMRPEDWFYTFVQNIAAAVDKASKNKDVRKFFVDHENGKKTLTVVIPEENPLDADYSWFLDQMTNQIRENIHCPNYVSLMTSDFSTSSKNDRIISSITTMMSLQEFFEYDVVLGCGIPAVAMRGTEDDWMKLKQKIQQLNQLLKPIEKELERYLPKDWWRSITCISENLLETYRGNIDKDWWHSIIVQTKEKVWGPSGISSSNVKVIAGWYLQQILGMNHVEELSKIENPLVSVPMKVGRENTQEEAAFVAGIVGYTVDQNNEEKWPRVSATHAWTLLLKMDSMFRRDLKNWREKVESERKVDVNI